jgi:hypothetical protein
MARRIGPHPSVTQVVTALRKRLHPTQLARSPGLGLNGRVMWGRAILVFLGITALGTYSVGRQSAPVSSAPVAPVSAPASTGAKSVAFVGSATQPPAGFQPSVSSGSSPPPTKVSLPERPAGADTKPAPPEVKRKVEGALTAAAIAPYSCRPAAPSITPRAGHALVLMTPCVTAEPAAVGAPIHGRAGQRRSAIRAT